MHKYFFHLNAYMTKIYGDKPLNSIAQSARAVEYTDCISAVG